MISPTHLIKLWQNFLLPFLNFYDNFIHLAWIVQKTNLKIKKWSPLWLLYVISLQDCLLFMFLYVVTTKILTHFSDTGLKVYRQETQKSKQRTFSDVASTALPDFSPIWYTRRLKNKFFKKNRYYELLRDFGKVSFI